jgi:hypothetical protein
MSGMQRVVKIMAASRRLSDTHRWRDGREVAFMALAQAAFSLILKMCEDKADAQKEADLFRDTLYDLIESSWDGYEGGSY